MLRLPRAFKPQLRSASNFSGIHRGIRSENSDSRYDRRSPSSFSSDRPSREPDPIRRRPERSSTSWQHANEHIANISRTSRRDVPSYRSENGEEQFRRNIDERSGPSISFGDRRPREQADADERPRRDYGGEGAYKKRGSRSEGSQFKEGMSAKARYRALHKKRGPREWEQEYDRRELMAYRAAQRANDIDSGASKPVKGQSRLITNYEEWKLKPPSFPRYIAIPHTTAASQFLYGHSVVSSALAAQRRKLYRLYIVDEGKRVGGKHQADERLERLRRQAALAGVKVTDETRAFFPMMETLSKGRPHGNCILEASPLPILPVTALSEVKSSEKVFVTELAPQTREDIEINGGDPLVKYTETPYKYPFVIYLDGITDEGNMGAILRSAYLFGATVAIDQRRNAPLDFLALKSASGAAEGINLLEVQDTRNFLQKSRKAGWQVYTADMPRDSQPGDAPDVVFTKRSSFKRAPSSHSPLSTAPTILILSNEDIGVRELVRSQTDYFVGVTYPRSGNKLGVDSLNVSTAAAVLCMRFGQVQPRKQESELEVADHEEAEQETESKDNHPPETEARDTDRIF